MRCWVKKCLYQICHDFEDIAGFFTNKSQKNILTINKLFFNFIDCFFSSGAEKLQYPQEFQNDVKLYIQGHPIVQKKFEDVEIRYLMLSDFYDFCRLTKRYVKK
jgi:hypothetical protein